MADAVDRVWAKLNPYKSLIHHLIDVGACADVLMHSSFRSSASLIASRLNISFEKGVQLVSYLSALHDIGKCHPSFQCGCKDTDPSLYESLNDELKLQYAGKEAFRHEKYSEKVLKRIWKENNCFSSDAIEEFTTVIGLHHQGKSGHGNEMPPAFQKIYFPIQSELERRIRDLFCPEEVEFSCEDWSCVCILFEGIMICADWIASGSSFDELKADNDQNYRALAMGTAELALRKIGIVQSEIPYVKSIHDIFPFIDEGQERPMQKLVQNLQDIPELTIIEDSTGSGKTEAAVYLAMKMAEKYHKHGVYFALPTAATSNQMFFRLNNAFRNFDVAGFRLLHGCAWAVNTQQENDYQNSEPGCDALGSEWLAPTRKGMLSANAVGTVDQAMLAVLRIKYTVLRMLGLTEKVIVIDEIHAYDAYMSDIISLLLEWCSDLNIPVIMLSATLPEIKKRNFLKCYGAVPDQLSDRFPLLTAVDEKKNIQEYSCSVYRKRKYHFVVNDFLGNIEKTAEMAIAEARKGGNICVMLNTVDDSQKVYLAIQKRNPEIPVMLFHARFTLEDRQNIENRCLKLYGKGGCRPDRSILVCTQVIEQSLDVDFDEMITQIAPIDLLIQRAGRVQRFNMTRPKEFQIPTLIIMCSKENESTDRFGTYHIYYPDILKHTLTWINTHDSISVPEQLRNAVESVYGQIPVDISDTDFMDRQFSELDKQNNARGHEIGLPDKDEYYEIEDHTDDSVWGEDSSGVDPDATTRDGCGQVRVVFAGEDLYQKYNERWYDHDIQKDLLMHSVSLRIDADQLPDPEQRGRLKGYIILDASESYLLKNGKELVNNHEIGVYIEEH